jgi:PmbA protein
MAWHNANEMMKVEEVGRIAAERTVRRLKGRKLSTLQCPVLFEAPIAASLIGHFVGAVSGGSLYRKSSFLLDKLDQPIFSESIFIDDIPPARWAVAYLMMRRAHSGARPSIKVLRIFSG